MVNKPITATVSVVLAVKNEEKFVEAAVTSILEQQGVELEVIVVDDNSSDRTFSIVESMAQAESRLTIVRSPGKGKCAAFNRGIDMARGKFICIFAGDDIMPPGSLLARLKSVQEYSEEGPVVGLCKIITMSENKKFDGHVVPRRAGRGALSGASPLMNRAAVEKMFPVPESLPNEDTWMELAILHSSGWRVVHTDTIGCQYRVHTGNSINMLVDFDTYNAKITPRMRAVSLFLSAREQELSAENRAYLRAKAECEAKRVKGDVLGILRTNVGIVEKLRAVSISSSFFYEIRRRLYGIFTGW